MYGDSGAFCLIFFLLNLILNQERCCIINDIVSMTKTVVNMMLADNYKGQEVVLLLFFNLVADSILENIRLRNFLKVFLLSKNVVIKIRTSDLFFCGV